MTLFADFVTNTPVTYNRMRELLLEQGGGLQEGAVGAGDLKVSQHAGAANMSVDVAVGAAWVAVDTGFRNGISHVYNDSVANVSILAADATNPRVDQVVLQYNDSSIPAGVGGDVPTLRVIAGTPTSGATLANRTGAASLPNDAMRLADVLVPAASSSVVTANIVDRRSWARGVNYSARGDASANYTTTSTTLVSLAAGAYDGRFELGVNSEIEIDLNFQSLNVGGSQCLIQLAINGTGVRLLQAQNVSGAADARHLKYRSETGTGGSPLRGGSNTWAFTFSTSNGANAATVVNSTTALRPILSLREIISPAAPYSINN